jgi:hypothetical protein
MAAPLVKSANDVFKPGWNPGLGRYVNSKHEYNEILKRESIRQVESGEKQNCEKETAITPIDDSDIKMMKEIAPEMEISTGEAEAIKSGVNLSPFSSSSESE